MLHQKWIINDGDLILGRVELHEELVGSREKGKTVGGGRWHYDRDNNIIYFYGASIDFGQVTEEQFNEAWKQPSVEGATIVFSLNGKLEEVIIEYEKSK